MRALETIKRLRFVLRFEIEQIPACAELKQTEKALERIEHILIDRGLQNKRLDASIEDAFAALILIARDEAKRQSGNDQMGASPERRAISWQDLTMYLIEFRQDSHAA